MLLQEGAGSHTSERGGAGVVDTSEEGGGGGGCCRQTSVGEGLA